MLNKLKNLFQINILCLIFVDMNSNFSEIDHEIFTYSAFKETFINAAPRFLFWIVWYLKKN